MIWLLPLLTSCGTIPHVASYPQDTGEVWEVPGEYRDPGALQVGTGEPEVLSPARGGPDHEPVSVC